MNNEIIEKITRRRWQILIHSVIYYQLNDNLISDYIYDMWSKELAELQIKYPDKSKEADLYNEFKNFDGSSGYDLPVKDGKYISKALYLLRICRM